MDETTRGMVIALNKINSLLDIITETLKSHKAVLEEMHTRLNTIDAVLYNHKETIEALQQEVREEYKFNKKEKVYVQ